jgi:hypothetical protein
MEIRTQSTPGAAPWPELPLGEWKETLETLHMWMQVVGKIRLAQAPFVNHWWHVPFYLTARGLTTSPMPYGDRLFEIDFDFIDHALWIRTGEGSRRRVDLVPRTVADFYAEVMSTLRRLGFEIDIWTRPVEIEDPIPFDQDDVHSTYDPVYAARCWRAMAQAVRILERFRGEFTGKSSPVHFFWGSFDLALTRFSGRPAPPHPGGFPNLADRVTREAYSHELASAGWWPGNDRYPAPAFYAYAYPEPEGLRDRAIGPEAAYYDPELGEFILPYDAIREAADPDAEILRFLRDTHGAIAELGRWDQDGRSGS